MPGFCLSCGYLHLLVAGDYMPGFTFALKKSQGSVVGLLSKNLVAVLWVAICNCKLCLSCFIGILLVHPSLGGAGRGQLERMDKELPEAEGIKAGCNFCLRRSHWDLRSGTCSPQLPCQADHIPGQGAGNVGTFCS